MIATAMYKGYKHEKEKHDAKKHQKEEMKHAQQGNQEPPQYQYQGIQPQQQPQQQDGYQARDSDYVQANGAN